MEKILSQFEIKKLDGILKELTRIYKETDRDPLITLPAVFARESQEDFVTCWLAYLLDPKINGFGVEPLNALLRCVNSGLVYDEEEISVEREFVFADDGKRIDLLITTPDLIIGIENKLYSSESGEQTKFYWKGMEKLAKSDQNKNKSLIGIYLKPEANMSIPKCENFKIVTYSKLCEELHSIEHDHCRDHRKNFFFYEFLVYVEEKLMLKSETGFPEITEDVKLYSENQKLLDKLQLNYENYTRDLSDWLKNRIKEMSNGKLHAKAPATSYWQILGSTVWNEDSFHFELVWEKKGRISSLTKVDKVWLCVHLEKKESKLKELFEAQGKKPPYKDKDILHKRKIEVDFSNEEESKLSIDKIIEMLKTEEFRWYSDFADEYYLKIKKNY